MNDTTLTCSNNQTAQCQSHSNQSNLKFEDPFRIVKVTNLPSRTQNPNLKENLYDEFLKYGKIISIRIDGEGEKKICYIFFKHSSQAQLAVENLNDRLFLNQTVLKVEKIDFNTFISNISTSCSSSALNSSLSTTASSSSSASASSTSNTNNNLSSSNSNTNQTNQSNLTQIQNTSNQIISNLNQEEELDEYCSKATRTLYIGNLDRDVKHSDLREKLDKKYGDIIEIEIKKDNKKPSSQSTCNSYAFIQFSDIKSVIKAMRCMNGKCIGNNLIKLGFGKSKPTKTLWLDGISEQLKESQLTEFFRPYCESNVEQILIDRIKCQALVYFGIVDDAKQCAERIRAKRFYDKRIMVDFASKEFISSRFEHLLDPKHHLFTNHNRNCSSINSQQAFNSSTNNSNNQSSLSISQDAANNSQQQQQQQKELKPLSSKRSKPSSNRVRSPRSNSLNDSRSSSSSSSSSSNTSSTRTRSESADSNLNEQKKSNRNDFNDFEDTNNLNDQTNVNFSKNPPVIEIIITMNIPWTI